MVWMEREHSSQICSRRRRSYFRRLREQNISCIKTEYPGCISIERYLFSNPVPIKSELQFDGVALIVSGFP